MTQQEHGPYRDQERGRDRDYDEPSGATAAVTVVLFCAALFVVLVILLAGA